MKKTEIENECMQCTHSKIYRCVREVPLLSSEFVISVPQ